MNTDDFVSAIATQVCDAGSGDLRKNLESPPGRQPAPQLLALSQWFRELSDDDRANVSMLMDEAARAATFGFFCVLDEVRVISDGGADVHLTVDGIDVNPDGDLHETFTGLRPPF